MRRIAAIFLGCVALYLGYLRMALAVGTNADGASITLQSWDALHGNVLLHGWVVADVSFYTVELVQFSFIELFTGLRPEVLPAGAALSYTLVVLLVGALAKGRANDRRAWARVALALAFVVVPQPGWGQTILLNQPDHIGTAVPLLAAWWVLDRSTTAPDGSARQWPRASPYVLGGLLVWGQLADPLVTLIGVVPLVLVGFFRLSLARRWRPGAWRCPDAALVLVGGGSLLVARAVLWLIHRAGGFTAQPVPTGLVSWNQFGRHLSIAKDSIAIIFGAYFVDLHGWLERTLGVLHLASIGLALAAVALVFVCSLRRRGELLDQLLAVGIVINLVAFVVSALNSDVSSAREIAPVLPLVAVLTARVWLRKVPSVERSSRQLPRFVPRGAAVGIAAMLVASFVSQASVATTPATGTEVAHWLASEHLSYGLGGYWTASTITLDSGGAIHVVPVTSHNQIEAFGWESKVSWYDPGLHQARFIIIDLHNQSFGTVAQAVAQFGQPVSTRTLPTSPGRMATVLIYDKNLLIGLPAWCSARRSATTMAACGS